MDIREKISLLPWLDFSDIQWEKLLSLGNQIKIKKGKEIVKIGEIIRNLYYLKKGRVKVSLVNVYGAEKIFWYVPAGNLLGEVVYFLGSPSNASIVAEDDCEIIIISNEIIENNLLTNQHITMHLLRSMARKVRVLLTQLEDSFYRPVNRVCKLLYLIAHQFGQNSTHGMLISKKITHSEIANITGVHRVTVTNILTELRKKGVITKDNKGQIIIKDLNKLYRIGFEYEEP